jgi:hypothetical protein
MNKINPSAAYYIKLGAGGKYEHDCIEGTATIRLGYNQIPHDLCLAKQWDEVRTNVTREYGSDPGTTTRHVNQIRAFYEADESVLWTTFYNNNLWWCFARQHIELLPDGSKTRSTLNGWHSANTQGQPLDFSQLGGRLLSMQGFRGTICSVKEFDYLVRKINAETSPAEQVALEAQMALRNALIAMIRKLSWKDFELLVDLIFRQAGWQRISPLGKAQKGFDIDLLSPIAQERYLVQVKSKASLAQFEQFKLGASDVGGYSRYYFVVHSPTTDNLDKTHETDTHKLWLPDDIAQLTLHYGLADWVIGKAR